jgi:hypothetical protein
MRLLILGNHDLGTISMEAVLRSYSSCPFTHFVVNQVDLDEALNDIIELEILEVIV